MTNPIQTEPTSPAHIFLTDPAMNLRRRLNAILAAVQDQLNQNQSRDELSTLLARWFFTFRSAVQNNNDLTGVLHGQIEELKTLLEEGGFRADPFVRAVLNDLIPRLQVLFANQMFPAILPNDPPPPSREERLRQIRTRILENSQQRQHQEEEIRQNLNRLVDDEIQQQFHAVRQEMTEIFEENMGILAEQFQADQENIQHCKEMIHRLADKIAHVETAVPQLKSRIDSADRALDHLEVSLAQAKQEASRLEQAIDANKKAGSSSLFASIIGVAASVLASAVLANFLPPNITVIPMKNGGLISINIPL
jgi:archaellum component FlaC